MKNTKKLILIALAVAINIAGSKLALFFSIPLFLDSIGTMLAATILGPVGGAGAALVGGLISGALGDVYAIYFAPSSMIMGIIAGFLLHNKKTTIFSMTWKTFLIVLPGSALTAIISTILFSGVTSSVWATVSIAALSHSILSLFASSFLIQIVTDYFDKLLAVFLVHTAYKHLPEDLKHFN
jgi:energy-coupling factor transport system substrate-specific component